MTNNHLQRIDPIELIVENSFVNFHAKGLHYLCLRRSPSFTLKAYFFEGDCAKLPEVVNPHDHRYDFSTLVISGMLVDRTFERVEVGGETFQSFDYRTPLNGGDGFTYRGDERLEEVRSLALLAGQETHRAADSLHTITVAGDETILLLSQGPDVVPLDRPTSTWVRLGNPQPDTSGLYDRMTHDRALALLGLLNRKGGLNLLPASP